MPSHLAPQADGPQADGPHVSTAQALGSQAIGPQSLGLRAALLTGPTRGAVATLAVSGCDVGSVLAELLRPANSAPILPGQVRYAQWHGGAAAELASESVVVTRPAADTAVGQSENWEIHCHGGAAAAARLLEDLRRSGVAIVPAADWTLTSGEEMAAAPRVVREATAVLIQTESRRTAAIALDQIRGGMREFVEQALAVDFSGAPGESLDRIRLRAQEILARGELGRHLHQPWRVVLAGRPNVGKSSLINALLGYRRSITMDQPGTTRDVLEARTMIDGWPIRLSDTAGIRGDAESPIEVAGIAAAGRELAAADLVLWVEDATDFTNSMSSLDTPSGSSARAPVADGVQRSEGPAELRVINKIDQLTRPEIFESPAVIATSATTGRGMETLRRRIVEILIPDLPQPGVAVPLTPRQEACLRHIAEAKDAESCQQWIWQLGYEPDQNSATTAT